MAPADAPPEGRRPAADDRPRARARARRGLATARVGEGGEGEGWGVGAERRHTRCGQRGLATRSGDRAPAGLCRASCFGGGLSARSPPRRASRCLRDARPARAALRAWIGARIVGVRRCTASDVSGGGSGGGGGGGALSRARQCPPARAPSCKICQWSPSGRWIGSAGVPPCPASSVIQSWPFGARCASADLQKSRSSARCRWIWLRARGSGGACGRLKTILSYDDSAPM
eukprot:4238716-Prymnesium_polylepis.1